MKKTILILTLSVFIAGCAPTQPRSITSNALSAIPTTLASTSTKETHKHSKSKKSRSKHGSKNEPAQSLAVTNLGSSTPATSTTTATTNAGAENSLTGFVTNSLPVLSAAVAGIGGKEIDRQLGTGSVFAQVAANAGAIIGGKLAQYLTAQDRKNIFDVFNNTEKTQPVAWCSDSKVVSANVQNVECGKTNKIIATPGMVSKSAEGEVCRSAKTEVAKPDGEIETVEQQLCKNKKGEWYEKTA